VDLVDPSPASSRNDDVKDRPNEAGSRPEETEAVRARARSRLRAAADALSAAQGELEDTVSLGRSSGITWDEIAEILGMTRQGASKRFGKGRLY
jgi:hypothetical protein